MYPSSCSKSLKIIYQTLPLSYCHSIIFLYIHIIVYLILLPDTSSNTVLVVTFAFGCCFGFFAFRFRLSSCFTTDCAGSVILHIGIAHNFNYIIIFVITNFIRVCIRKYVIFSSFVRSFKNTEMFFYLYLFSIYIYFF